MPGVQLRDEFAHGLPGGKSSRFYYYYRCAQHMKDSYDGCSNYRHYRAEELGEQVWQEVRSLLRDPDRLRAGMDTAIEMHRAALRSDPEREAKAWLEKLVEVERKRARYQEMAAEELITLDELRGKLVDLEDIHTTAERELEEVRAKPVALLSLSATGTLSWRVTKPSRWRSSTTSPPRSVTASTTRCEWSSTSTSMAVWR